MTLQEIRDEIAPHLNLDELNSLLCFVERRIADVERGDAIRKRRSIVEVVDNDSVIFMRLSKVSNREDVDRHSPVEVAKVYEGTCDSMPKVGSRFVLVRNTLQTMITSVVTELLPDNQFKTKHSVYRYEIL